MATIYTSLNDLYDKAGYLARYGGDLYITIFIFVLVFLIVSYYAVMNKIKPIKADWIKQRCNPSVVPFAGLIYKPEGKTTMEATADNFSQCAQTVTQNIAGYALQPLQYLLSMITSVFAAIANAVRDIRAMFDRVRDTATDVGQDVMGRSLNVVAPVQLMLASAKSAIGKTAGIGTSSIYTLYGAYLSLKSLLGSIIQFIILILVALVVLIITMWIMPWTWPIAIAGTAVFIVMAAMMAYLIVMFSQSMHGRVQGSVPKKPR